MVPSWHKKEKERAGSELGRGFEVWAFLLTVKQDTVKTSNQISDTRWGALSGLRLEQPVICEPTLEEWGTGRRSQRIEDWLQIPLRGK